MSTLSPLIANWIENKLSWKYIYSPIFKPRTLSAREMFQISNHEYPEGVLILGGCAFDSPMCGVRLHAGPNLDSERTYTINTLIAMGWTSPNVAHFLAIPPTSPSGIYLLHVLKEWVWLDFFRLYIYNDDTVPHTYLFGGYTLAVLEKPRPTPSREVEMMILKKLEELLLKF